MGSHRRPAGSGLDRSSRAIRVTVLSATASAAALVAAPADAAPPGWPTDARAEVLRLYQEAEHATEAYNGADERSDALRRQVSMARDRLARGQRRVNLIRGALGSLAGAQYRRGGVDPAVELILSSDPGAYLDKAAILDRIGSRQARRLRALRGARRDLEQRRAEAVRELAELEKSRQTAARHKRVVERRLTAARRLLLTLPPDQLAAWAPGGGRDPFTGAAAGAASSRAAAAVAAVRSAIGRPYVWGANGPSGFDCSGLMQWAYGRAGVSLPRTSQAQRYAGRRIPLSRARPGDLVAYRQDASHIAMYVGNGRVVHAPYPGARVRSDPVDMLPVSSVTRI